MYGTEAMYNITQKDTINTHTQARGTTGIMQIVGVTAKSVKCSALKIY